MTPRVELKASLAGFFKIEAVRPDGSKRLLADWFPNLITDAGLDHVGNAIAYLGRIVVGSGNTAPANSDTTLVSQIASTTNLQSQSSAAQSSPPYYGSITFTRRFATGVAAGNLSEVGVGPTSGSLFSRALILDGVGSPTTITVLSDEALDVTYELRMYVPTADVTSSIVIAAVTYNYTIRASIATNTIWCPTLSADDPTLSNATAYTGAIGAITSGPSGGGFIGGATSYAAVGSYSNGDYHRDSTATFGLNDGNDVSGIRSCTYTFGANGNGFGRFQIDFGASIPKDSSHVLTLGFRVTWARH